MSPHPLAPLAAAVPHRHPMLLADRLDVLVPGCRGSAWKAVSANETQTRAAGGLPRTLLVDALGQLAIAVLASPAADGPQAAPRVYYLAEIERMEFADPALPGDLLRLEATVQRTWGRVSRVDVQALVEGRRVARGTLVLSRAGARVARTDSERRSNR